MINVSEKWKENQNKNFVSESYIKITLDVNDPNASSDASPTSNGELSISDSAELMSSREKNIIDYATLEKNLWLLDGSKKMYPMETETNDNGFISEGFSFNDCSFANNPIISISFSKVFNTTIPAITIAWDRLHNEFPTKFKITSFNGENIVDEITLENNSAKTIVSKDFTGYDSIQIEILKWCLPCHRARIESIFLGLRIEYSKEDLVSFSYENEVDPIGATNTTNSVSFELDNSDSKYDPDNDEGISKYLVEQQRVIVKCGYKIDNSIEWIPLGMYYLSNWKAPQNGLTASFEANNILTVLANKIYYKGDTDCTEKSLYDIAVKLLSEATIPVNDDGSKKYIVSEELKKYTTSAPLPLTSYLENLQYIAQATCSSLYVDRNGDIHIEPLSTDVKDYSINGFNMYSYPEIELQTPLSEVLVNIYHYSFNKEEISLTEGDSNFCIQKGKEKFVPYTTPGYGTTFYTSDLPEPVNKIEKTGYTYGCVFFTNEMTDEGTPVNEWNSSVNVFGMTLVKSDPDIYSVFNSNTGEVQTVDNPLITNTTTAKAVGEWVKMWLNNRKQLSGEWRTDPRIDCLDTVKVKNKFDKESNVRVTYIQVKYDGSFKGEMKGRVI